LFIWTIVFDVLSTTWVVWRRGRGKDVPPVLVASAFMAVPYTHHVFARADIGHLAQGIFPLLIGCLVFLTTRPATTRWALGLPICAASLWTMYVHHPGWQFRAGAWPVGITISGNLLFVDAATANDVHLLRTLAERYAPPGETFIATPMWPGAHALLERKSPMWEIYTLVPRPPAFERAEIERIAAARPRFAVVLDVPFDGREDLRFRRTHPLIQQYIDDHFELAPDLPNPALRIYTAKDL
jgi:hypothetical protein